MKTTTRPTSDDASEASVQRIVPARGIRPPATTAPNSVFQAGTKAGAEARKGRPRVDLTGFDVKGRHQGYIFMKGSADTCTDPDCFAEKKKAHLKREAEKLAAGGATVVGGNAAKAALSATGQLRNGFVPLADVQKALKKAGKKPDALKMQTVLIQDPRDGKVHKAVKAGAMVEVGLDAPAAASKQSDARYAAERERAKEKEAERELKRQAWQVTNTAVLQRTMTAMAGQPISAEALTWVVEAVFEALDWPVRQAVAARRNYEHENDLRVAIAQMQPGELALLAVELVLSSDVVVSPWQMPTDDDLVRLNAAARHYGIDPDAVRAEVTSEPISTPSIAARAADKPAAKPTKPKSKGKALRAQEQKDDAGGAGGSDADLFSAAEEAEA